jgi:hypothetical protein
MPTWTRPVQTALLVPPQISLNAETARTLRDASFEKMDFETDRRCFEMLTSIYYLIYAIYLFALRRV